MILLMAGCSSSGSATGNQQAADTQQQQPTASASASPSVSQQGEGSATRIVTDARGEQITIPANPQRIVDIAGATEELLVLGFQPIASGNTDMADPSLFTPIVQAKLDSKTLNTGWYNTETNPEIIMEAAPDLILAGPPQAPIYDKLSQIAPTVLVPYNFSSFRERFAFVADVLDKKDEMYAWLKEYDARAAQLHDEINKAIPDETFAIIEATAKEVRIYSTTGVADIIYSDLKLPKAPGIPDPDKWGGKVTSIEGLSTLNPDHIILMSESEENVLKDSKIWSGLKAVKDSQVYQLSTRQNYNEAFTALGKQALLEQLANDILK
ncbi:ABC transporter substrate-binding protein [Paenibacillus sp. Leaf72]|nr:ABC transporter substrate-binding protein [Paenibacillus sp. Leaf72]